MKSASAELLHPELRTSMASPEALHRPKPCEAPSSKSAGTKQLPKGQEDLRRRQLLAVVNDPGVSDDNAEAAAHDLVLEFSDTPPNN